MLSFILFFSLTQAKKPLNRKGESEERKEEEREKFYLLTVNLPILFM